MAGVTVSTEKKGNVSVVKVTGFIDSDNSSALEKELTALVKAKSYRIIIDLHGVDYVSSAGWGIFISYVQELRKNKGDIKFSNMRPEVREIFELLDFANILEYHVSVDSAIRAF